MSVPWRTAARLAAVLFAGALGGGVGATAIAQYKPTGHEYEPRTPSSTVRDLRSRDMLILAGEHGDVLRRLSALEDAGASSSANGDDAADVVRRTAERTLAMPEPTPEHDRELQAERENWARAHADESKDEPWAQKTAADVSNALRPAAERARFVVRSIDCRTTRCRVELEWPSYAVAAATFGEVLHTSLSCGSAILLDPPVDPTAPYRGWVMYDCEEIRAASP
jgi:hypothetical protein